jgi:hypothetical protein
LRSCGTLGHSHAVSSPTRCIPEAATDAKIEAIIAFGRQLIAAPGGRTATSDEQIVAIIGLVSLQLVTGGFNRVANLDDPRAVALA